ncbi:hypothetical protein Y032_1124g3640 [Ancylostoma ceylanicum]|nr:hypothetical protein Y032_1124g3640 [Ancylostoma ceylanicum]
MKYFESAHKTQEQAERVTRLESIAANTHLVTTQVHQLITMLDPTIPMVKKLAESASLEEEFKIKRRALIAFMRCNIYSGQKMVPDRVIDVLKTLNPADVQCSSETMTDEERRSYFKQQMKH